MKNSEKKIVAAFERKIGEKVGKGKPCRICEKKNKGIVTPLIKIELLLNDTLKVLGIYDSGSSISLINSKLLCMKNKQISKKKM